MKSLSEFVELSTAHARKQFEAMTAQTKELTELAQKVTTEIAAEDWRHGDTKDSPQGRLILRWLRIATSPRGPGEIQMQQLGEHL